MYPACKPEGVIVDVTNVPVEPSQDELTPASVIVKAGETLSTIVFEVCPETFPIIWVDSPGQILISLETVTTGPETVTILESVQLPNV